MEEMVIPYTRYPHVSGEYVEVVSVTESALQVGGSDIHSTFKGDSFLAKAHNINLQSEWESL